MYSKGVKEIKPPQRNHDKLLLILSLSSDGLAIFLYMWLLNNAIQHSIYCVVKWVMGSFFFAIFHREKNPNYGYGMSG